MSPEKLPKILQTDYIFLQNIIWEFKIPKHYENYSHLENNFVMLNNVFDNYLQNT